MSSKNIWLVIPTIRDLDFFTEWGEAFSDCHLLIVEDRQTKTVSLPHKYFKSIHHVCWQDIKHDFNTNEWIFSRHNAGIRSYGFWKAWKLGADVIMTLDDDCYPLGDPKTFVPQHVDNLEFKAPEKWYATYPDPQWMFTRGFPYEVRNRYPIKVSHGIWSGALDLDGQTESRLSNLLQESPYPPIRQVIPFGYFYPMCSMNLAFHRDVVPLMFFPMMGENPQGKYWGYDRYDDIWAGIFSKKVMDHLKWGVVNGSPQVEHRKASLPHDNLQKELTGLKMNDHLWQQINNVQLTQTTVLSLYQELIDSAELPTTDYFHQLRKATAIWLNAFR